MSWDDEDPQLGGNAAPRGRAPLRDENLPGVPDDVSLGSGSVTGAYSDPVDAGWVEGLVARVQDELEVQVLREQRDEALSALGFVLTKWGQERARFDRAWDLVQEYRGLAAELRAIVDQARRRAS